MSIRRKYDFSVSCPRKKVVKIYSSRKKAGNQTQVKKIRIFNREKGKTGVGLPLITLWRTGLTGSGKAVIKNTES